MVKQIKHILKDEITFLVVDLFCGFGGTTLGFEKSKIAKAIAAINHDRKAIKSHWLNHPDVKHFEEDIRTLDLTELIAHVQLMQSLYPNAKLILWASLECTNHSRAKGGMSRDADSRTLAEHLIRYIEALNPDYVQIENVVEFKIWGPLKMKMIKNEFGGESCAIEIKKGKVYPVWVPDNLKLGEDFNRWCKTIDALGYRNEWTELNSANFGSYTSRNRLFGCFAKDGLPIQWPTPTHSKNGDNGLYKWKACKEVLDLEDEGESIFTRKKPLCDNTLKVIYKGAAKALKEGNEQFMFKYYGNGDNLNSINVPAGTLTTKDRFAKVCLKQIFRNYKSGFTTSVESPLGTVPTVPKAYLLSYIFNPQYRGHTITTEHPCPTIIARQDKAPLYLVKAFMTENNITDIKMRMLKVSELLTIQGFPANYKMVGSKKDQTRFIGNSVESNVVKEWAITMDKAVKQLQRI